MSWSFDNTKPIYLQIMEKIKLQIVSHELEPNQQLPTVRELASEAGVNPNTIQRALSDLEREGFVYSKRTTGRFVTEDLDTFSNASNVIILHSFDVFAKHIWQFFFLIAKLKHARYKVFQLLLRKLFAGLNDEI